METNTRSRNRLRSVRPAELEAHLGYWLQLVANHVSRRLAARMKKFGASEAEWMVLRELYRPNPPAAIQLASAVGMTRSALSKLLVRLSQKQLIETWPAPSDRRTIRIELTSTGRVLTEVLGSLVAAMELECFGHVHPIARQQTLAVLRSVARRHHLRP